MKKIMLLVFSYGYAVLTTSAQTNSTEMSASMPTLSVSNSYSLWRSFDDNIEKSATTATQDRFGDLTRLTWMRLTEHIDSFTLNYVNESGKEVFEKTAINGARETIAHLPITRDWYEWAESLWTGSIGNTDEEHLGSTTPAPTESERSWWQRIKSDGNISYGARLDDPAAYITARFGHWFDNPALIIHARVNYRPINRSQVEVNAIAPIPYGEFSCGASFDPLQSSQKSFSAYARLSHGLLNYHPADSKTRFTDSILVFVGVNYGQRYGVTSYQFGFTSHLP